MEGVCKSFGATRALHDVRFDVRAGEVHALVGENGAGKSTLMKVLSGAIRPDSGRMQLDGRDYSPKSPADGRRLGVAMVYQELSLAPHLSVLENILLGIEPTFGPLLRTGEMRRRAAAAVARVTPDGLPLDTPVRELPSARQQLVEIARAVASGCRVLVLDEPTSSLTQHDTQRLFELIRSLKSHGVAVIYISHFLEEVREVGDRFTVLRDGCCVGAGSTAVASAADLVRLMVGRETLELYPRSPRQPGAALLSLDELAGERLPRCASLSLHRGEVFGIAGMLGAGRTELLRAIFGLAPIRGGTVRVGAHGGPASPVRRWRSGVGFVSEDRKSEGLATRMTIAENLALPRIPRFVTPGQVRRAIERWVAPLQLRCRSTDQPIADLSGGNQQKVALARLLHADADVWLLDEPTRGIDVGAKALVYALIDSLARGDPSEHRRPRGVLMVSSYLPELLGVCDRIAVMHRGRLGEARPVERWSEHSLMLAATAGEDQPAAAAGSLS